MCPSYFSMFFSSNDKKTFLRCCPGPGGGSLKSKRVGKWIFCKFKMLSFISIADGKPHHRTIAQLTVVFQIIVTILHLILIFTLGQLYFVLFQRVALHLTISLLYGCNIKSVSIIKLHLREMRGRITSSAKEGGELVDRCHCCSCSSGLVSVLFLFFLLNVLEMRLKYAFFDASSADYYTSNQLRRKYLPIIDENQRRMTKLLIGISVLSLCSIYFSLSSHLTILFFPQP